MISRTTFAAVLIAGTAGTALADVDVNTPGARVRTPSGGVNLDIQLDRGTADRSMMPKPDWVGRPLFSIDGKRLGAVVAVSDGNVYADIGGFLGIGESRVMLSSTQIGSATEERVVAKLTEAEAKDLPKIEDKAVR
ncbi:MAG TPA: hypothetical protein VNR88_06510 [Hyphomicrobium sp.]|nr:hypothetical protein [Hyphomicrobium sp.]